MQRDGVDRLSVLSKLLQHNDTHGGSKELEQSFKDVTAVAYAGTYLKLASCPKADCADTSQRPQTLYASMLTEKY
jgi:hypothetical protein